MTKLPLESGPLPIRIDHESGGALRVGSTRVTVQSVLGTFRQGSSPDEILARFPVLAIADIYGVIAHYLRHRVAFDEYLDECERREVRMHEEAMANGQAGLRDRLLARLAARKVEDDAQGTAEKMRVGNSLGGGDEYSSPPPNLSHSRT